MKFARNAAVLSAISTLTLIVAGCSTPPADPNAQTYERDRPTTGSNIGKRYQTGGPDVTGVTTYTPTLSGANGSTGNH